MNFLLNSNLNKENFLCCGFVGKRWSDEKPNKLNYGNEICVRHKHNVELLCLHTTAQYQSIDNTINLFDFLQKKNTLYSHFISLN